MVRDVSRRPRTMWADVVGVRSPRRTTDVIASSGVIDCVNSNEALSGIVPQG